MKLVASRSGALSVVSSRSAPLPLVLSRTEGVPTSATRETLPLFIVGTLVFNHPNASQYVTIIH